MIDFEGILENSLRIETKELDPRVFSALTEETNVFELVDSLLIVNILLQSEMQLEAATGNYVTLADETMFDAEKSPLRSWGEWVRYVKGCHESR